MSELRYPLLYGVETVQNGCNFYRIKQPVGHLIEKGLYDGAITSYLVPKDHELWLGKADLIVTQVGTSEKFVEYMIDEKPHGRKFVIDYDDNLFCVSPLNPSYLHHGQREVDISIPSGFTIKVRDGENGFDLKANRRRIETFKEALRNADLVTTPSPALAEEYKKYSSNVRVLKNLVDMKLFAPLPLAKDEYVRIGWQGGWSHYEDFVLIQSVLERIMHKFKNVILIICGTPFEGVLKNLPKERIQLETWTSVETYPWKFKGLNIDIGIAPLIESTFNDCKSEIKWEEYSALKIATVASQTGPYARAIDHEKTGLLAKNDDEWVEYLSRLIKDVKYRKKLAKQAHEHVKANYGLESNIGIYDKAYKSLYKPELIIV